MPQLDYNDAEFLLPGHVALGGVLEKISKFADVTTQYGLAVCRGADAENSCKLPTADTDEWVGIAVFEQNEAGEYKANDVVNVGTKGSFGVPVPTAVTVAAGEDAYIVATGADAGKFTNVSTSNIATGFKFGSAKKNDDLAILRIDLAK